MLHKATIIKTALAHFTDLQALYLFGSFASGQATPESDVDIALLLCPTTCKAHTKAQWRTLSEELEKVLNRQVDLINLRDVDTIFRKEIIMANCRIHCADTFAADEFEMLTLSFYQKLNEERADILDAIQQSGRIYNP